ncbi:MAG: glucokinase [Desulfovibrio sp.]|jgi:glucokinase|nr:glucokinase [Desulfovibrio sp.]
MTMLLAADIGATNARFALFAAQSADPDAPLLALVREQWLKGAEYATFSQALAALRRPGDGAEPLLADGEEMIPEAAVIAPAGPILGPEGFETCRISNLPWLVRADEVRQALGIKRVSLINDFVAQGYACLMPEAIDAVLVLPGAPAPGAPVAVVGAGTGFGKALVLPAKMSGDQSQSPASRLTRLARLSGARVLPSEGGHAEVPFSGKRECAFAEFASRRVPGGRLIGDAVLSGSGLALLVAFITGKELPPHEASAEALKHPEVLDLFARFYARVCRSFVLDTLALGGVYVTGGMALRLPVLERPAFAGEFYLSAAQRELLSRVPLFHVRKAQAGLFGAALAALLSLGED